MKDLLRQMALIGLLVFFAANVFAQTGTDPEPQMPKVVITMNNGEEYTGEILEQDEEIIVLRTANGVIELIASNVRSVKEQDYQGKFTYANPHDTRYFFGPSAIPIKKGKGYYQNVAITFNFVNYGITKNISIGGGLEFISTILGQPIWFLTPKAGFQLSEKFHIGGGVILAGFADEGSAALTYGVTTFGSSESNLSLGVGYGLMDREFSDYPAVMVGGMHRLSRSIALLTENYLIPNEDSLMYFGIQGIRILSRKNAFDVGVIVSPEFSDEIPVLPYVGYVRIF